MFMLPRTACKQEISNKKSIPPEPTKTSSAENVIYRNVNGLSVLTLAGNSVLYLSILVDA